jgi:hypothetical protein
LYKVSKLNKYPKFFNFNLENNLNVAKQQRWLVKNSLLTESIIPNSFLITQSKKLLGTGLVNKDFSNSTLWLPTKHSNLSSAESSIHLNNISNQLYQTVKPINHLKTNQILHSNFVNINFFENSRIWLFKKYFFNSNQNFNTIIDLPVTNSSLTPNNTQTVQNINFTTNIYTNSIISHLNNNLVPSISARLDSTNALPSCTVTYPIHNNIRLSTSQLDIISGSNVNFFATITSNPKQLTHGNTGYFNMYTVTNPDVANSATNLKFNT